MYLVFVGCTHLYLNCLSAMPGLPLKCLSNNNRLTTSPFVHVFSLLDAAVFGSSCYIQLDKDHIVFFLQWESNIKFSTITN